MMKQEQEIKATIFISHSSKDNEFALRLARDLRRILHDDNAVWIDESALKGGDAWWQDILQELSARSVFLVIWSPDASASGWVQDEVNIAWRQKNSATGKVIIPVLWRECALREDLATRQVVPFTSSGTYDGGLKALLEAIGIPPEGNADDAHAIAPHDSLSDIGYLLAHPELVAPGAWSELKLFFYLESVPAPVLEQIHQLESRAGGKWQQSTHRTPGGPPVGTELIVDAQSADLEVEPRHMRVTWVGEWQAGDFLIRPTSHQCNERLPLAFTVISNQRTLATVQTDIHVADTATAQPTAARAYQRIFACYSHKDRAVVEAFEQASRALGETFIADADVLVAGENWEAALRRAIESADVFQLFWSRNAAQSPFVAREWQFALSLGRERFIRPVYWEQPLAPIPPELARIHFHYVEPRLLNIRGVTGLMGLVQRLVGRA